MQELQLCGCWFCRPLSKIPWENSPITASRCNWPCQETDSSTHLDKQSQTGPCEFELTAQFCTAPKCFNVVRGRGMATCLLSKEACLYMDIDWLSFSVSQRVARGQLQCCKQHSFLWHLNWRKLWFGWLMCTLDVQRNVCKSDLNANLLLAFCYWKKTNPNKCWSVEIKLICANFYWTVVLLVFLCLHVFWSCTSMSLILFSEYFLVRLCMRIHIQMFISCVSMLWRQNMNCNTTLPEWKRLKLHFFFVSQRHAVQAW